MNGRLQLSQEDTGPKNKNITSEMFSIHCYLSPAVQDDLND